MIQYFQELIAQFSHPVTAAAQILGFVPMLLGYFVFRYNSRKTSITIKAVSDFLSAVHFLLLGESTGCIINCVNTARGICFAQKGRQKWASGIWLPILFCLLTLGGSVLGWTGIESLLPLLGSCLAVVGYWCKEPGHLRKFNFAGIFLWLIYGILTLSVSTIIGNVISLFSIVQTELRVRKNKQTA